MNLKDLTFEDLKNIKYCVAIHLNKHGDAVFPDLLNKLNNYCIAYQSGLDFGKKYMDELTKVIKNE